MKEIDETTLVSAQRGNRKAFDRLYKHYSPFIWRICYRAANGERPIAEELMQNIFIKVHRSLEGFSRRSAFSTWLYTIAYSGIKDFFISTAKHNNRMISFEENSYSTGSKGESYDDQQLVKEVLTPLSETDKFLLTAREVDGISYEDLSSITGETEGALRTRLSRLKAGIRTRLSEQIKEAV